MVEESKNILIGGVNYSLEEQLIGTWIDGKPLYQKSFVFRNISYTGNSTTKTGYIYIDMSNYDMVIIESLIGENSANPARKFYLGDGVSINAITYVNEFQLEMTGWWATNVLNTIYITIRYTKK